MGMKPRATPWQRKASAALRDSIAHWERMRDGGPGVPTPTQCACCRAWRDGRMSDERRCSGCPIRARTGKPDCVGTPYDAAHDAAVGGRPWADWHGIGSERFKRAADAEIVYLRETLRLVERGELSP